MAHVVSDWQQVKRFGRWKSDVFQKYVWDSHEQMSRVSRGMAMDDSALTRPRPSRSMADMREAEAGARASAHRVSFAHGAEC